MKNVKGITLIALIITIIVLLILAGIALNSLMGKDGIINNAISSVDKANITADKERIQLAVIELITEKKQLTVDNIVDKLIEKGITTEANVNRDTNQVKTDKGYIFDININENGGCEVGYVGKGELAKTELEVTITKDAGVLTTKVTLTITAKSDSGIATYTNHDGDTKTYTNNEKEISEKYEVTANGTYNFTVKNKKGTSETKSIEISNILEGTVTIIASKTTPTNENITVEVTWPSDTTGFTKEISKNDGETWDEYTGIVTIEENCVVKARLLDSAGGVVRTATCDIQNIDKTNPTVTAKQETVTIKEGDSHSLGEYFTVVSNGIYGIASTVYTDTSNGNAVVSNTNTLAVGTHTIKCTVTKETGATGSANVTIVVEQAILADGSWTGEVNSPMLMNGMTAVYWSTDGGATASTTQEGASPIYSKMGGKSTGADNSAFKWENWYNYVAGNNSTDTKTSRWANAVTDDGSYWVWIPRFKYKISEQPTTVGETIAGKIEVQFIPTTEKKGASGYTTAANSEGEILTTDSSGYIIHPAFENGSSSGKNNGYANGEWDSELPGFWVAKYEMSMEDGSGNAVTTDSDSVGNVAISSSVKMVSKPGVPSWRYIQIGQIYQNCINYDTNKNSHMMKNSEWGAVAYLTHSQYGRNRNEVTINDSSGYYTGNAGDSPTDSSTQSGIGHAYNTTAGMKANTTGNIYGVYDMSGGVYEMTACWETTSSTSYLTSNGKAIDGTVYFSKGGTSDRTKTVYSSGTNSGNGSRKTVCRSGDGIKETWVNGGDSWYKDSSHFPAIDYPFLIRGGVFRDKYFAGVFSSNSDHGGGGAWCSFRAVLAGEQ